MVIYQWQLKPKIKADFVKKIPQHPAVILQLTANRGLTETDQIEKFFKPTAANNLLNPFIFKSMKSATDLIIKHLKAGSPIVVYGDYDADGVTASVLLAEVLAFFKAKVSVYLPDRITEGYGLNKPAIKKLAERGAKLIITVDNGIRNKEEVEYAKNLGLALIITDHHQPPKQKNDWPDCLIIDPLVDQLNSDLAGVGVAFKLAKALISRAKLNHEAKEKLEKKVLDLVAIGTVADCVSLLGENRTLVYDGLEVANQQKRLGLAELIKVAQLNPQKPINSWNIAWQIAPRLNSAGRLDHANTAFELLISKNRDQAADLAKKLNEKNQKRQKLTEQIFAECQKKVEEEMLDEKILILFSPNIISQTEGSWTEGVIGLVAGRLVEKYSRPAILLTKIDKQIKGSARSIAEFDITACLEQVKKYLSRYGGHAAAAGFTLKTSADLTDFIKEIKILAKSCLTGVDLSPKLMIEAEVEFSQIDEDLVEKIYQFEPFGQDNPRPRLVSRNLTIADKIIMGDEGQHLKFRLGRLWAVGFGQAENWSSLKIGEQIDLVYFLEFNDYDGRREVQLKIIDLKKVD